MVEMAFHLALDPRVERMRLAAKDQPGFERPSASAQRAQLLTTYKPLVEILYVATLYLPRNQRDKSRKLFSSPMNRDCWRKYLELSRLFPEQKKDKFRKKIIKIILEEVFNADESDRKKEPAAMLPRELNKKLKAYLQN